MNKDLKSMLDSFTFDEHMRICFTPNMIIDTVLYYSDKVQNWCRDHRVPDTIKLSRRLNDIKANWYYELRLNLDQKSIDYIKIKSEEWRGLMSIHLTQLFYTMNNALLKVYQSQEYLEVINNALTAIMMIQVAKQYNRDMNYLIQQRLPDWRRHVSPHHKMLDAIGAIMLAYIPGEGSPLDEIPEYWRNNLQTSVKIFMQQLKSISYE